ncbi:hypothetical protein P3L10_016544 [Capsicum annuum]
MVETRVVHLRQNEQELRKAQKVLDAFLAHGSELWMFNEVSEKEREKKLTDGGLDICRLANIILVNREGNAVIRRHLESLPLESFDSILILADESVEDSAIQADSRSLATLLLIRDFQAKRLPYRESMVSKIHGVAPPKAPGERRCSRLQISRL